ncbi:MAG: DUF1326 domain-containing protein [Gammaproteobacteria bacterium]
MATDVRTQWRLRGTVVVACNCEYGCPCNFNARPSHGHCEGGWTWHVAEGSHDDVRLDGLNFSLYADWPAAIHDGNGEALMLIDERADERQRETMRRFLAGQIGGPWAILVNTFVRFHGPRFVPYEVALDEERSRVHAGDALELATEPIRNPVTGVEVHPRAVLPEGMIFKDGALISSSTFTVRGDVAYDHSGKYAAVAPFEYKGQ